ncbi:aspartic proteinase 36-like [Arachis duranensis]|uniref:Aspartic proteinase 36-like n=1 Tax=Arachis duranensis TaxID=130453 RepID=A0A9C6TB33_ARADU|nr:aspartic proteinase 36-like [Arachis duranensis]
MACLQGNFWCIGWQNSETQSRDNKNMILLGDLALSNKLVFYNLEGQVIGWTEYNCSSSIKVRNERTATVHLVGCHYIPTNRVMMTLFLIAVLHKLIY